MIRFRVRLRVNVNRVLLFIVYVFIRVVLRPLTRVDVQPLARRLEPRPDDVPDLAAGILADAQIIECCGELQVGGCDAAGRLAADR